MKGMKILKLIRIRKNVAYVNLKIERERERAEIGKRYF